MAVVDNVITFQDSVEKSSIFFTTIDFLYYRYRDFFFVKVGHQVSTYNHFVMTVYAIWWMFSH